MARQKSCTKLIYNYNVLDHGVDFTTYSVGFLSLIHYLIVIKYPILYCKNIVLMCKKLVLRYHKPMKAIQNYQYIHDDIFCYNS